MPAKEPSSVVPAQLSYLAIYNPSLGPTDETLGDQIVFYYSRKENTKVSESTRQGGTGDDDNVDNNERLRQIGLAQGMVNFAKNFSNGEAVNTVDTEKSRITLHELETGWWILASVDYTRLSAETSASRAPKPGDAQPTQFEYSSREVAPPLLILQQLLKAHAIFLLHHAPSLDILYNRLSRTSFCSALDQFWTRFIWGWDALLNGNPAVDILNGIKLAATGELGIGVGEEEWGSGEREVLEDFISRTNGLVDMVVSRFGDPSTSNHQGQDTQNQNTPKSEPAEENQPWIGCKTPPRSFDGVIFSGVGTISKQSLTRVSHWMEWIYRYGEDAFGVRRDPKSTRRRKRRTSPKNRAPNGAQKPNPMSLRFSPRRSLSPGIPPPLVIGSIKTSKPRPERSTFGESSRNAQDVSKLSPEKPSNSSLFSTDSFMKLLTSGYGPSWPDTSNYFSLSHPRVNFLKLSSGPHTTAVDTDNLPETSSIGREGAVLSKSHNNGRFIIGLRDDLEIEESDGEDDTESGEVGDIPAKKVQTDKTVLRTLSLKMQEPISKEGNGGTTSVDEYRDLQVVVYLNQPFMFTFLFELKTPSLSSSSFYRSIHHQLGPLQRPLLLSTSLDKIPQRAPLWNQYQSSKEKGPNQQSPLYDLIYDPTTSFIHTSLPNIPEPGAPVQAIQLSSHNSTEPAWSRQDILNVHMQILTTYIETRNRPSEVERTCMTSRGWWVLWMRLKDSSSHGEIAGEEIEQQQTLPASLSSTSSRPALSSVELTPPPKEAFLVRKASDYALPSHARKSSGARFFRDISGASAASQSSAGDGRRGWSGPGKLAEGVGLDARRYIEALLNLNR
ncbi:hypothetical protein ACO22_00905 [Paracoccidioides brasiliensis]|uniref:CCZ1/INTU/HSP4 first Longin domain-containing protein n=1 Tax=Paracoccidioides brasiliensis TaxID=121759 RepID=A0A1D2JMZ5_PARBR|nr:hypothetical protein ACO22_00905 [Paracoccidioides brasiliensis]